MAGSFPFGAHQDGVNQVFTGIGVVGTLGTADIGGTAKTLPISVDPTTGAQYSIQLGTSMAVIPALSGTLVTTATVVGTTTVALPGTALANRKAWVAYNTGTITIYIGGGTGITSSNAIPVGTSAWTPGLDLGSATMYGIAAGTVGGTIVIMEVA